MDANGARFHLLLGYDDWANCAIEKDDDGALITLASKWEATQTPASPPASANLDWDARRHELTLERLSSKFKAAPNDRPPRLSDRRGAACDRYGNWYWLGAADTDIWATSSGSGQTSRFWPPEPGPEPAPSASYGEFKPVQPPEIPPTMHFAGLAVTEEHYLLVGVVEPAGLLIFDLHAGGPPQYRPWPTAAASFVPFDIASAPGGGVWILDRANRRYWALDRQFRVLRQDQVMAELVPARKDDFQPVQPGAEHRQAARLFPTGITLDAASPVPGLDPIAIAALPDGIAPDHVAPDGAILILDRGPDPGASQVWRYRFGQMLGQPQPLDFTAHDFAFVPAEATAGIAGNLYVVSDTGNQADAFDVIVAADDWSLRPVDPPAYLPMRLFGGKALIAAGDRAYYDSGVMADDNILWAPLVEQSRPKFATEATCFTPIRTASSPETARPAFDGRQPDCVWHRLMLDACIPPDTDVQVWSRAANDERSLALAPWQAEPALHRRGDGSELPFAPVQTGAGAGTWELLFQRARGRYLQLKLKLTGNGRVTPRLQALRAYYPRFSYLQHYLPAVYGEDPVSASFLDRFLANIEGLFTSLEDKIAAVQILFDVRSAPPEVLEWLASWFGVVIDPAWDEPRRRLFIAHAMTFFQFRGTMPGVIMALRLALDDCVGPQLFEDALAGRYHPGGLRLVEKWRTRRIPPVLAGDPTQTTDAPQSTAPRFTPPSQRWNPKQGGQELHRRYGDIYPVRDPGGSDSAPWREFSQQNLGFTPGATDADATLWQAFLARRHQRPSALALAYGLPSESQPVSFAAIPVPNTLPADGAALQDWYDFERVVVAMWQTAHQFSILLPMPTTATRQSEVFQRRLGLAQRIAHLEKPAHTTFDVRFYWALFRVGEARLGEDTLLDQGSRAAHLLPPMVLGQEHLAESYVAAGHPFNINDRRYVLGREALDA